MERPVRLDPSLWTVLECEAADEDVSVAQIIRDAINRDIRRRAETKVPVRADERLVAPLRALLADDFANATGWDDLQARLVMKGYCLAGSGGGLILLSQDTGLRICKASELGYSYSALLRRFDSIFPGHARSAPVRRIRGQ
jgi:hypothetical protein